MGEASAFLTAEEVAAYLRLPLSTVYRLAQTRVLPGFKVGKHWRFKQQSINAWIDLQEQNRPVPLENNTPSGKKK